MHYQGAFFVGGGGKGAGKEGKDMQRGWGLSLTNPNSSRTRDMYMPVHLKVWVGFPRLKFLKVYRFIGYEKPM